MGALQGGASVGARPIPPPSTKISAGAHGCDACKKSLIYRINSKGPRMYPMNYRFIARLL